VQYFGRDHTVRFENHKKPRLGHCQTSQFENNHPGCSYNYPFNDIGDLFNAEQAMLQELQEGWITYEEFNVKYLSTNPSTLITKEADIGPVTEEDTETEFYF
jgi:hypothetical protein